MREYEYAVFIGRFQPFHNGHLEIIREALKKAQNVIVAIGSSRAPRTIKNPWTFDERAEMILDALGDDSTRVSCTPLRDYFYNDQLWLSELHQKVRALTDGSDSIALVGQYSDESSYYLNMFPQWKFVPIHTSTRIHATEVRSRYFKGDDVSDFVPPEVQSHLVKYAGKDNFHGTYRDLVQEFVFTEQYKAQWANAPYPPTFVTTDTVVVQSGHVLLVKRKFNPGKGLWALPGGFLNPGETIIDSAIRELYEETKLLVPKAIARAHIVDEPKVFDYPGRSLRGRTITHAICIHLKDGYLLPDCKGADDAEKAQWVPIGDLHRMEEQFFEDHLSIIEHWLHQVK